MVLVVEGTLDPVEKQPSGSQAAVPESREALLEEGIPTRRHDDVTPPLFLVQQEHQLLIFYDWWLVFDKA